MLPIDGPPIRDGQVTVEDGHVLEVGPAAAPDVFHEHCVITPGLVNAHAHLEYGSSFADLASSGLPFPQWIRELTRRRFAMDFAQWEAEAADGVTRSLEAGVTCVADIVTNGPGVSAVAAAGLPGISYLEAVGADHKRWPAEEQRLLGLLAGLPANRQVGISPHTLYTLGTSVFAALLELARSRRLRIHTHLAETMQEAEFVLTGTGRFAEVWREVGLDFELMASGGSGLSPAAFLESLGGLGPDVHVAHGVHLSAADRNLLRSKGSRVSLCPRSNAILGAGTAPFAALLADGAAIGTDSLASSPSLSVLDELRTLKNVAPAQVLIEAATVNGARAMGLRDVGVLAEGARGDLVVWDVGGPVDDPYAALLENGTVVETVLFGYPVFAHV